MSAQKVLEDLVEKYKSHPGFIGGSSSNIDGGEVTLIFSRPGKDLPKAFQVINDIQVTTLIKQIM